MCKDDRLPTFLILACDTHTRLHTHAHVLGTTPRNRTPCRSQITSHEHSRPSEKPLPGRPSNIRSNCPQDQEKKGPAAAAAAAVRPRVRRPARGCEPAEHAAAGGARVFLSVCVPGGLQSASHREVMRCQQRPDGRPLWSNPGRSREGWLARRMSLACMHAAAAAAGRQAGRQAACCTRRGGPKAASRGLW